MRYKLKKDQYHGQIASELIESGFSVADTSRVGCGFPDLAIARNGVSALVELKTPEISRKTGLPLQSALARRSASQIDFHSQWKGPIITAYNALQVVYEFNLLLKRREAYAI